MILAAGERTEASSEPDSPTRRQLRDMDGWAVKAGGDFYGTQAAI